MSHPLHPRPAKREGQRQTPDSRLTTHDSRLTTSRLQLLSLHIFLQNDVLHYQLPGIN